MKSSTTPRRISFHPMFRMHLLQMLRHGELKQAIAKAGNELAIARKEAREADDSGQANPGGIIIAPSLSRLKKLGYTDDEPSQSNSPKGPKL